MAHRKMIIFGLFASIAACKTGGSGSAVKVVGGTPVAVDDPIAKSTVEVKVYGQLSGQCSGTLIDKTHVLTAAHCFDPILIGPLTKFEVIFGLVDSSAEAITISGSSYVSHPEYNNYQGAVGFTHVDIAVLTMAAEAPSPYEPVKMLQRDDNLTVGDTVIVAGFGISRQSGPNFGSTSGTLRQGPVRIQRLSPDLPAITTLQGGRADAAGTCHGDSGGPVYLKNGDRIGLVGVISGGNGTYCDAGRGSSTDIRYLTDWIGRAQRGEDTSARSDVPKGKGSDGQLYNYCRGHIEPWTEFGEQPAIGGKCLWPS